MREPFVGLEMIENRELNYMRVKSSSKLGFTLVEIMIVVAIIGVLAAVAIPSLVGARKKAQAQACKSTLQTIAGVKVQWALDLKKSDADVPTDDDLFGNGKYIDNKPSCPAGGTYDLKSVADRPTCSIPDHTL